MLTSFYGGAAIGRALYIITGIAILAFVPGCDKDNDGANAASQEYFLNVSGTRPAELSQAYTELQGGQHAQAYQTSQNYIAMHRGSPYTTEAHYIAGQALAAQGQFAEGK